MVTCERVLSQSALEKLRQQRDGGAEVSPYSETENESGRNAGFVWGASEASFGELKLLSECYDGTDERLGSFDVAEILDGDPEGIWGVAGDDLSFEFVAGWVAGALEVYRQVNADKS